MMQTTMSNEESHSALTSASLLAGIQAGREESWQVFCRRYGPIIRGFALKAGLAEIEAEEVVQETCIGLSRNIGEFCYDRDKCRFKTWLLNLASWRVKDQFAKRERWEMRFKNSGPNASRQLSGDDTRRTATVDRVAAPGVDSLESIWDAEWRANLLHAAVVQVRESCTPTQFQIFDLAVIKQWPTREVAQALGVNNAMVYLTKHRISKAVKKTIERLEDAIESRPSQPPA